MTSNEPDGIGDHRRLDEPDEALFDAYPPEADVADDEVPEGPRPEPVAISSAINTVVAALVGAGWLVIPATWANIVTTVAGLVVVVISTLTARNKVKAL